MKVFYILNNLDKENSNFLIGGNMEYLKNTYQIIKYNLITLIKFEIIFMLLLGLIFIPIAIGGFNLTMKLTGYSYLTLENIFDFAFNP